MLIGYARVSKGDGSQKLDLQLDALKEAGVEEAYIYSDMASGAKEDRPGLANALKVLREGDTLVIWKLDRLGRNSIHTLQTAHELIERGVELRILTGVLAGVDTRTVSGKFMLLMFAGVSEMERGYNQERTLAGLAAARKRGRVGGRPPALTGGNRKMVKNAMKGPETNVSALAKDLGVSPSTLYRIAK